MSKIIHISRYLFIIKKLTATPYSTYEELQEYIKEKTKSLQRQEEEADLEMQEEDLKTSFSKRTLQRDLRDIRDAFGVDIEYSKAEKGYFISYKQVNSLNFERMMEAFEVFNSLKTTTQDVEKFVHLEKRKPKGTEHLYDIIQATKKRFQIKFLYQSRWGDVNEDPTERITNPYALKEFNNRWYLLAKDHKDETIKSFGLDRLTDLQITNKTFEYPKDYSVKDSYNDYFGIYNPKEAKPQEIVLSFKATQGRYIIGLPLHHTQSVISENEQEIQIKLFLCATFDFVQELLSFGNKVKVLAPQSLIEEVKIAHQEAFEQYK